jgi:hypothetical protein
MEPVKLRCPFCGERFETLADDSAGDADYIEDCPVCCRPISLHLRAGDDGDVPALDADRDE